jgi:rRNA processing protein Gar1
MRKVRIIELGHFYRYTLKNKWLIKIENKNVNFIKNDPIGFVVLDENKQRVGKVLDIIGNVNSPYALVEPFPHYNPPKEVYIELVEKVRRK